MRTIRKIAIFCQYRIVIVKYFCGEADIAVLDGPLGDAVIRHAAKGVVAEVVGGVVVHCAGDAAVPGDGIGVV